MKTQIWIAVSVYVLAASRDEKGIVRQRPALFSRSAGRVTCTYFEKLPPFDELAATLASAARPPVTVEAPQGILYNAVTQSGAGRQRILVQLLNYTQHPASRVKVKAAGKFTSARLLSPDTPREPVRVAASGPDTEVEVPSLGAYSLLILERQ